MYVHTYVCRIMASQKTLQKCIGKFGPERVKLNTSSIIKFQLSCIMATYKNERLTKIRSQLASSEASIKPKNSKTQMVNHMFATTHELL